MKNRTVLARLAALGMSIVLCFGVVGCGEKEDSSDRSRTEKDADEDDDKEEDEKEDESKENEDKEEEDEKERSDDKKEGASGKDESRNDSKEDAAVQSGKEERTVEASDSEVTGHYVATVDLGVEYFLESMGASGLSGKEEMFRGADFTFDATLDLKDDGTGVLGLDVERLYGNLYDFMDEHYLDMMKEEISASGYSDKELQDMVEAAGYKSMDELLEDYKKESMEELAQMARDNSDAEDATAEFTWEEDGDTIRLINEEGDARSINRNADGSLTIVLEADQSVTGTEMELVFKK